jgi:hypothetical protein
MREKENTYKLKEAVDVHQLDYTKLPLATVDERHTKVDLGSDRASWNARRL